MFRWATSPPCMKQWQIVIGIHVRFRLANCMCPRVWPILFGCWEDQSPFTCNTSIYHHIPSYAKSSAIFWSRFQASHASFEAIQHPFWSYGLETISYHVIFNHQQTLIHTLIHTFNTPILGLIFFTRWMDGWMDG